MLLTARLATCIQVIVLNGVRVFQWFSQMHVSNISRHCATCGVEEYKGNETRKHMFNSRTSLYIQISVERVELSTFQTTFVPAMYDSDDEV